MKDIYEKHTLACTLAMVAGLAAISTGAEAAGAYMYCIVHTAPDPRSSDRQVVVQGNIAKMIDGQVADRDKLKAQYIDFVNEKHPSWFKGYRETPKGPNPDAKYVDFQIQSAVRCDGYHSNLKDAQNSQVGVIKETQERNKRIGYAGTVEMEKDFVYKP